jgi:hypothetical protein
MMNEWYLRFLTLMETKGKVKPLVIVQSLDPRLAFQPSAPVISSLFGNFLECTFFLTVTTLDQVLGSFSLSNCDLDCFITQLVS